MQVALHDLEILIKYFKMVILIINCANNAPFANPVTIIIISASACMVANAF